MSKFTFKDLLEVWKNDDDVRIEVFAKYDYELCSCNAKCHLETSKKLHKYKVIYHGLNKYNNLVVVLNMTLKQWQ